MEMGPGDPDLGGRYSRRLRADRRCGGKPTARMARSGLHTGRVCRNYRTGHHAFSAFADWRILTGTVGPYWAACTSLDWRRTGHGCGYPRRWPLDPQPPDMIDALLFS